MDPAAVPKKLLYVSDPLDGAVVVYTYPEMTFAGVLTGFVEPTGLCTDRAGDVWIADSNGFSVYEYAHGGTNPIAQLTSDLDGPTGCAIDPKSGSLAVTNSADWVAVFPNAIGTPAIYQLPPGTIPYFDSYDSQGNLFVDGVSGTQSFLFYELAAGSSAFAGITLNESPAHAGDVGWDGKHIVLGDLFGTLYQTQGSNVVGTIDLTHNSGMEGFYIAPSHKKVLAITAGGVNMYTYPAASYVKEVTGGFQEPFDVVISQ